MGQEFDASLRVSLTISLQKSRPYFSNPVVAYEPAIFGRRSEDAKTRGLAPFWETTIHIEAFISGFCNCHTDFSYDSTLLDADRIVLCGRVVCFAPDLFSTLAGGMYYVLETYGMPTGRQSLFEWGGFLFHFTLIRMQFHVCYFFGCTDFFLYDHSSYRVLACCSLPL